MQFVNINGKAISYHEMQKTAAQQARPKFAKDAPAGFHKGFRVEGHSPDAIKKAKEFADTERAKWLAMTEEARTRAINKDGRKEPKEWNEAEWRGKTKKKPLRSKPYEIRQSALECADLARRSGWLDVDVIELSKGDPGKSFGV